MGWLLVVVDLWNVLVYFGLTATLLLQLLLSLNVRVGAPLTLIQLVLLGSYLVVAVDNDKDAPFSTTM
jgi:hypothetical protein